MRAVIICGGSIADYDFIRKQIENDDTIICADSGYDHAVNMGLKIEVAVGDFDSISAIPQDVKIIRHPARKDQTDSEIALDQARNMGFRDFLLLAATGTRLDHTLTNILMLKDCLERGENAVIIDEHNKIMITDTAIRLREPIGAAVSIIPLSECTGVTTAELEYPLHEAAITVGKGIGVSNIIAGSNALISVKSGVLLVVIARD